MFIMCIKKYSVYVSAASCMCECMTHLTGTPM